VPLATGSVAAGSDRSAGRGRTASDGSAGRCVAGLPEVTGVEGSPEAVGAVGAVGVGGDGCVGAVAGSTGSTGDDVSAADSRGGDWAVLGGSPEAEVSVSDGDAAGGAVSGTDDAADGGGDSAEEGGAVSEAISVSSTSSPSWLAPSSVVGADEPREYDVPPLQPS